MQVQSRIRNLSKSSSSHASDRVDLEICQSLVVVMQVTVVLKICQNIVVVTQVRVV